MKAPVIGAVVNRSQPGPELNDTRCLLMFLEGRLILPHFDNREAVRPADFLNDIEAQIPFASTARFAVLVDHFNTLIRRGRLNVDIRRDIQPSANSF